MASLLGTRRNSSQQKDDAEGATMSGSRPPGQSLRDFWESYKEAAERKAQGDVNEGDDVGDAGLKEAVLGWSGSYYVAYALIMTIGFALILATPEPRQHVTVVAGDSHSKVLAARMHWRPASDALDAIVTLLYVVFSAAVCYDSTWGTLITAEWSMRGPTVPASRFSRFLQNIEEVNHGLHETWGLHCFDTRVHHASKDRFLTRFQFSIPWIGGGIRSMLNSGLYKYPAFDGYFILDRVVLNLFLAATAFLYLTQGLAHACICLFFTLLLVDRFCKHLSVLAKARHHPQKCRRNDKITSSDEVDVLLDADQYCV